MKPIFKDSLKGTKVINIEALFEKTEDNLNSKLEY